MLNHDLDDICKNCGEDYGSHNFTSSACPIRDPFFPRRRTGFEEHQFFNIWEEDDDIRTRG